MLTIRRPRVNVWVELAILFLGATALGILVTQVSAHLGSVQPQGISPALSPIISPLLPPMQTVADDDESGLSTVTRKGSVVSYTIVVNSTGVGGPAHLTDTLPDGTEYVPDSATMTAGALTVINNVIYWNGDISAAQPLVLTIGARLGSRVMSEQVLVNRAEVSNDVTPVQESNAVTTIVFNPYLQVPTARVDGMPANKTAHGGRIAYTFLITAPADAGTICFTDTLPYGIMPIASQVSSSNGPAPSLENNTILWSGPVSSDNPVLITIPARLRSDMPKGKILVNIAHTDGPEGHADSNPVTTTITLANIHAGKRLNPNQIHGRALITSTLVLTSENGIGFAVITDTLPPNMAFVPDSFAMSPLIASHSANQDVETHVGYDTDLNAIVASLQVDAGSPVTLTWRMTYTLIPTTNIVLTDPATILTGTLPFDTDPATLAIQPYLTYLPAFIRR